MIAHLLNEGGGAALFFAGIGLPVLVAVAAVFTERVRPFARANAVATAVGVLAWMTFVAVLRDVISAHGAGCYRALVWDYLLLGGLVAAALGAISAAATHRFWTTPSTRMGAGVALLVTIVADVLAMVETFNVGLAWSWACF